jgi:hypothetical protein
MSKLPSLGPSLTAHLVENRRQMQRQANSSSFARSGMSATAEGETTVDGTLNVGGNLAVSGHAAITGTLSLPSGIIGNDALANPVVPGLIYAFEQPFALTTSDVAFLTRTVTVPAGFTSAAVSVVGRLFAINPNAGYDYLSAVSKIDGTGGASIPLLVQPSGGSGINVSPFSRVLTGLTPGGTFSLEVRGNTNVANWASNVANTCELSGSILWFR